MPESAGAPVFRLMKRQARRQDYGRPPAPVSGPAAGPHQSPRSLGTVRLADGRLVEGRHVAGSAGPGSPQHPTLVLARPPGGPGYPRRRRLRIPRRVRWTAVVVVVAVVFRR